MILQVTTQEFLDITGALVLHESKCAYTKDAARLEALRHKLNVQFSSQVVAVETSKEE